MSLQLASAHSAPFRFVLPRPTGRPAGLIFFALYVPWFILFQLTSHSSRHLHFLLLSCCLMLLSLLVVVGSGIFDSSEQSFAKSITFDGRIRDDDLGDYETIVRSCGHDEIIRGLGK
jgi:hypothetical protein